MSRPLFDFARSSSDDDQITRRPKTAFSSGSGIRALLHALGRRSGVAVLLGRETVGVPPRDPPSKFVPWAENHLDVLEAVWEHFDSEGVWPAARRMTRERVRVKPRRDFLSLAREMPTALGRPQTTQTVLGPSQSVSDEVITLTPWALSFIPAARPLVEAFGRLIEAAVHRYEDENADAYLNSTELPDLLGIDDRRVRQLQELVAIDGWLVYPAGGEAENLRLGFNDHAVLTILDSPTLERYFEELGKAWYPEPAVAIGLEPEVRDEEPVALPELRWLHPIIFAACAQRFADGYLRDAVVAAAIALLNEVRALSGLALEGKSLMQLAFAPDKGHIVVAEPGTESGRNIQQGTHLIAQGAVLAIRNPSAHELAELDVADAIERLAVLSFIARRLEFACERGYSTESTVSSGS